MPTMDGAAASAVEQVAFAPAFFIWIDFADDPLRVTTLGQNYSFSGTGDADLDGKTFLAFDPRFIQIGDLSNSEDGSDTLTVTLSGIEGVDSELMAEIGDRTKWQGRSVRIWIQIYDQTGAIPQGGVFPFYTGYASSVKVVPSPGTQTIQLSVENYLASATGASNRSYLSQKDYDASDVSAQATLAAANMGRGAPAGTAFSSGGGASGGSGSASPGGGIRVVSV